MVMLIMPTWASQLVLVVKNPPANVGDARDSGLIPGLGRSLGEGNGNPLEYSCLGNPMDRRAWRVTVHRVTNSQTRLCTHTSHLLSTWRRDSRKGKEVQEQRKKTGPRRGNQQKAVLVTAAPEVSISLLSKN